MSLIIGLGGVRAVGKSTLARKIGDGIRADVMSIGRIRDIIRQHFNQETQPEFFESITRAASLQDSIRILQLQSRILEPYLRGIIKDCRERQASLILEGTHLIPGLYKDLDLEVLLVCPLERLNYRIYKDKIRKLSPTVGSLNFQLQEYLRTLAQQTKTPIIDTNSLPAAFIQIIQLFPKDKLPKTWYGE